MKKITLLLTLVFAVSVFAQDVDLINNNFDNYPITAGETQVKLNPVTNTFTWNLKNNKEWAKDAMPITDVQNAIAVSVGTGNGAYFVKHDTGTTGPKHFQLNASVAANDNHGVYFVGLDLTGATVLKISFKIKGGDTSNSQMAATLAAWNISVNTAYNNTGTFYMDLKDFNFEPAEAGKKVVGIPLKVNGGADATTFDIPAGDGSQAYITVTAELDLTGYTLGTHAAIALRNSTNTGGFMGGAVKVLQLDDILITATKPTASTNNNELANAINVYPNPVSSVLNIAQTEGASINNVQLYDVTGKVVYQSNNANAIDVSNFSKGLYILKVASQDGATLNTKVIVE